MRRVTSCRLWEIAWRPERLSASFHGRDLFAPVAARLARGEPPPGPPLAAPRETHPEWPDDLAAIVYIDHYGNAMTGLRAGALPENARLVAGGHAVPPAPTFSAVPQGAALWYVNANGLVEIAVNGGRADAALGLALGTPVAVAPMSPPS
jgi:S-adenosylmethionine hydrolase